MKNKTNHAPRMVAAIVLAGLCITKADGGPPPTAQAPNAGPTQHRTLTVANFEKGEAYTLEGAPWPEFTDAALGGKSSIQIAISSPGAHGSKHALLMTGNLTPDFQWGGFVGVRAALRADEAPRDMGAYSGVRFYARGDGKTYRFLLGREAVKDSNHFYAEFKAPSDWKLIQLPFSKFAQSPYFGTQLQWSAKDITAVGLMAMAEPGATSPIKLEVDDIAFYSTPSSGH